MIQFVFYFEILRWRDTIFLSYMIKGDLLKMSFYLLYVYFSVSVFTQYMNIRTHISIFSTFVNILISYIISYFINNIIKFCFDIFSCIGWRYNFPLHLTLLIIDLLKKKCYAYNLRKILNMYQKSILFRRFLYNNVYFKCSKLYLTFLNFILNK